MSDKKPLADSWDDAEVRDYLKRAKQEMLPKLRESALSVTVVPDDIDMKLCVELGAAILLDKPIIAVVPKGRRVSANLKRVASCILEGEMGDPGFSQRLSEAIRRVLDQDARAKKNAGGGK